jgi:uncharacterized protein YecT (DUF1311 family)
MQILTKKNLVVPRYKNSLKTLSVSLRGLLIIVINFIFFTLVNAASNLDKTEWKGTFDYVEDLTDLAPEEKPLRAVNVYDVLTINSISTKGFNYRNAGNEVGYGPNEQTYFEGRAEFSDPTSAKDKKVGVTFIFSQGDRWWDKGITIIDKNSNEKHFKQRRIVFEAGFNCMMAATAIEKSLCSDPVLARADKQLGLQYRKIRKDLTQESFDALKKNQRAWIKKRNFSCQVNGNVSKRCLSALYASRLLELNKQINPNEQNGIQVVDAGYIKSSYQKEAKIWQDVIFRLAMNSAEHEQMLDEWRTYQPTIKAEFSKTLTVLTGEYRYDMIAWPATVLLKKKFQMVIDERSRIWTSIYVERVNGEPKGNRQQLEVFGPPNKPGVVTQWILENKITPTN